MPNRMIISRDSTAIECEVCGYAAVRVARLVADNGVEVAKTLVCTSCHRHRAAADR
ncbi:hypothetical protein [Amycolatopsis sp. cmx-11-51]|uniref:hypothetical protein n=1 Tax=unclassified Amycolatopsis TaxID=2618356 RepID=UPI0039E37705